MEKLLSTYRTISLDEMRGIKLMNRIDTKFVTTVESFMRLLELAHDRYMVQETLGERIIPYQTTYFDTAHMLMYHDHHRGQFPRQKVRIRTYVPSQLSFLEVKTKDNHRRTRKKRVSIDFTLNGQLPQGYAFDSRGVLHQHEAFVAQHLKAAPPQVLIPQLENQFNRVTQVNNDRTERLTIDTGLCFNNLTTGNKCSVDKLAIIELKRDGLQYSPVLELLRELRIMPHGFSKYCMGTAFTNPHVRTNLFKERIHYVERVTGTQLLITE